MGAARHLATVSRRHTHMRHFGQGPNELYDLRAYPRHTTLFIGATEHADARVRIAEST